MLLKFGMQEHLEKLLSGRLRLTPSIVYQKAEMLTGKRGMGDKFDSYLKFRASSAEMTASSFQGTRNGGEYYIICQDCEKMPMICFYHSQAKHIEEFSISSVDLQRIKTDFDNPDSVLIIADEEGFYKNIGASLGDTIFTSDVIYLHDNTLNYDADSFYKLSDGFSSKTPFSLPLDDGSLFYSINIMTESGNRDCIINRTNSYLTMFFKHHYFRPQQELRMIMPKAYSDIVITKDISPIREGVIEKISFLNSYIV